MIDITLDVQLKNVLNEVNMLKNQVDATERSIGFALHSLSFRYPEVAIRLREKLNKLRELQGMDPISDEYDPLSGKDSEGKSEAEEKARLEAEAEAAAKEALKNADDSDLTPAQKRSKFLERKHKEKCKRLYLKIAKMTHPDKVKDPDLNNVFHQAKNAYERVDLELLESMHKDVKDYTALKGNRGKFRDFKYRRVQHSIALKNAAETNLKQLKSGLAYRCTEAFSEGDPLRARSTYQDFIDEQCYRVEKAIREVQAQMRMQASPFRSYSNTTTSW